RRFGVGLIHRCGVTPPAGPVPVEQGWDCPQPRIALYLHNRVEYLEAMVGAMMARAVPVNVNYRYRSEELRYLFDDAAVDAIVYETRFAPAVADVLDDLDRPPSLIHVVDTSGETPLPGSTDIEEVIAGASAADLEPIARRRTADDRYILYTGGTTGMPKGVLWRQGDWLASALGVDPSGDSEAEALDALAERARRREHRILAAPPFMHGAAHWNGFSFMLAGGTVLIQDDPTSLDPADIVDTAERERATALLVVGDAFARPIVDELRRRPRDLSSLRHLFSSGAQLSQDTKQALLDLLPQIRIHDVLGSSESGRQATELTSNEGTEVHSGRFEVEETAPVLDESLTRVLDTGDRSMGWLAKTGRVPTGYLGDPDKTAATFPVIDGVRYSVPGDRARYRDDGGIELHGRDSVTINTGGEKVFAEEVEHVLKAHPAVFDAVVAPRPSEHWGQEVAAVVELRSGVEVTDEDLRDHTKRHLAGYKAPRTIVRVAAVQRSP
ncbi:MAG: AMP-binding protein, partial [Actinomycetota bacterium]